MFQFLTKWRAAECFASMYARLYSHYYFSDQVSMPTIILNRNKTDYVAGEDSSIDLICKSDGNPKPNFHWYKENMHEAISESENFTITDLNKSDSGIYTCNVSNTFNGVTYTNAVNVRINVMDKGKLRLFKL